MQLFDMNTKIFLPCISPSNNKSRLLPAVWRVFIEKLHIITLTLLNIMFTHCIINMINYPYIIWHFRLEVSTMLCIDNKQYVFLRMRWRYDSQLWRDRIKVVM
jgi:hypothetical protein